MILLWVYLDLSHPSNSNTTTAHLSTRGNYWNALMRTATAQQKSLFSPNENKGINPGARRNGSVLHNLLQHLCGASENMKAWWVFHLPNACKNLFSAPAHSQFTRTRARLPFVLPWHCRATNTPRLGFSKQHKGVKHLDLTEFHWMLDMGAF